MTYTTTWAREVLLTWGIPAGDRAAAVRCLQEAAEYGLPITEAAGIVDGLEADSRKVQDILQDRDRPAEDRAADAVRAILAMPDFVADPVDDLRKLVAGIRLAPSDSDGPLLLWAESDWQVALTVRDELPWCGLDPWRPPVLSAPEPRSTIVLDAHPVRPRSNLLRGLWRRLTRQAVA